MNSTSISGKKQWYFLGDYITPAGVITYMAIIALLMVSRVPTLSIKKLSIKRLFCSGESFEVMTEDAATVLSLKETIMKSTNYPISDQRLYYNEKYMENDYIINDMGLDEHSVIDLLVYQPTEKTTLLERMLSIFLFQQITGGPHK